MSIGNIIVGQSGGPTSVINASLAGVFSAAKAAGSKKIYGMLNGVEGLIDGRHIDLSDYIKNDIDVELLKRTPSSYLGTCRYKLEPVDKKEEDYKKIFKHLKDLDVKAFFYAGGNDSMDSINKLSEYSKSQNAGISFIGVPKTIDNDLVITDHTPGFGSAAKYVAASMKELILDAQAYNQKTVLIVEIMGRNAGWLTAASMLAKGEDNPGPDMVLIPELALERDHFLDTVGRLLTSRNTIVIAVSEGMKGADGKYLSEQGSATDSFGHAALSGTASVLKDLIVRELGIKRARAIEFSSIQRCAAHITSLTDVTEAFQAGVHAVTAFQAGETARMVVINRLPGNPYTVSFTTSHVSEIANAEKKFPLQWLDAPNYRVLDGFSAYAAPLIMGELTPVMVNGLPRHLVIY